MSLPTSVFRRLSKQASYSIGFSKYYIRFPGVSQYASVPYDASLDITEGTIDIWFRKDAAMPAWGTLAAKVDVNDWDVDYGIGIDNSSLYTFLRIGGARVGVNVAIPFTPTFGVYSNIMWTWAGGVGNLYINRVLADSSPYVGAPQNRVRPFVFNSGSDYWEGGVAEFHLYNRAITAWERRYNLLNYHSPIRNGLIILLRMEEGMGLTAYDTSGLGNDASLLPVVTPPTWERDQKWKLRAEVGL